MTATVYVALSRLTSPVDAYRRGNVIKAMVASIAREGLREPLVVQRHGRGGKELRIMNGSLRYAALCYMRDHDMMRVRTIPGGIPVTDAYPVPVVIEPTPPKPKRGRK